MASFPNWKTIAPISALRMMWSSWAKISPSRPFVVKGCTQPRLRYSFIYSLNLIVPHVNHNRQNHSRAYLPYSAKMAKTNQTHHKSMNISIFALNKK